MEKKRVLQNESSIILQRPLLCETVLKTENEIFIYDTDYRFP